MTNMNVSELGFDPEALRKKYLEERDKRLRPDGDKQYRFADEEEFVHYSDDPYLHNPPAREPFVGEIDVLIVGGGFAGIITGARLKQSGVENFKIIDQGGDFGGTWYWNRYPGCACDVESYIYLPLLEETGYVPTQKYVKATEILEHAKRLGRHFDLYKNALFSTKIHTAVWDEASARWIVKSNRGDEFRTRFLCVGSGPLNRPKLPGIPGFKDFKGHTFHTSRWDFDYTGGTPEAPDMVKLKDKRVGIIGTGATAVQVIPQLAKWAKQVYVFQRTPAAVGIRANRPTDPEWAASLQPGWQKERMHNFEKMILGMPQEKDLVNDGWTQMWSKLLKMTTDGAEDTLDDEHRRQIADFQKMEELRARVAEVVKDPKTAASLTPWYNMFCKRPLFHDEYLDAFNQPNVALVDTDGKGVERMTEHGVVVDGKEYEIDCLVYATGFDALAPVYRAGGFDPVGRGGMTLGKKWDKRMLSVHGILSHGFPNFFMVAQFKQASVTINFPTIIDQQAQHIADLIKYCVEADVKSFDVTEEAEQAWGETIRKGSVISNRYNAECTPSYWNNEGVDDGGEFAWNLLYHKGPFAFMDLLKEWRTDEAFKKDVEIEFNKAK